MKRSLHIEKLFSGVSGGRSPGVFGIPLSLLLIILIALFCFLVGIYVTLKMTGKRKAIIHSCLDSFRSLGHLLVFKIVSKEIVTVEEKAFEGMIGRIMPDWIFSRRRIIMIFEFSMNFSYDLRDPAFSINAAPDGSYWIKMPVPTCDVALKDLFFYDEQKSKFLPLLIPDIVNGALGKSFSPEEKNRLFAEAMEMVRNKANDLLQKYEQEVQTSARHNLEGIARSFGANDVHIQFSDSEAHIETRLNGEAA
jgi:hypothetical protein